MHKFRVSFLTLFLVALFSCAAYGQQATSASLPHGWVRFAPQSGRFNIFLPTKPSADVETVSEIAQNTKVAYFTATGEGLMVVVGELYDLPVPPERFSESERRTIYANFRDGLTNGIASSLAIKGIKLRTAFAEQKNVTLRGLEGYEQDMTLGDYIGRARILVAPERIYIFCAIAFSTTGASEIEASLDSFEYTGRRSPTPAAFRDVALLSRMPY